MLCCWEVVSSLFSGCPSQLNANDLFLLPLFVLLVASLFSIILIYIFWNNLKVTEKVSREVQITIFLNYLKLNWELDVPIPLEYLIFPTTRIFLHNHNTTIKIRKFMTETLLLSNPRLHSSFTRVSIMSSVAKGSSENLGLYWVVMFLWSLSKWNSFLDPPTFED